MPMGMIQMSVEESTPISHETEEPYCLSPEPTPLAKPILEVEVTPSKPIPESEFSSSALQIPAPLESHKVEVPEANGIVPSEELEPEVESSPEVAPVLPVACPSELESPKPVAPVAQPEELLSGAPLPPAVDLSPVTTTQVAVSVPKRRWKIKELHKKEAVGDLLDAFKEANPAVPEAENHPPIGNNPGPESEGTSVAPWPEEAEETWDSKEDKIQNSENIQPGEQKYDYKSDQWKTLNLEEKKHYDQEFLLGFQFIFASLQKKYLCDEQKELPALYALQALVVTLEQPPNLLRMFFDELYDEDMVKEEAFYSWESSKDPAVQLGKGVGLKSVTAFFNWLREAEVEESDHN
ncbi:Eukaryotic translation initiation factor 4 gamma 1 [Heterocephalus glaber]|uniref:Eukaryotic translation initiation factor 4 gamma 1 n=1 Tax=Heterocephalus glaber TaxID=10181 RepID=G5BQP3_HETGA|nr:Eukaryotic translation initiation factor 4 gamma 1 [Heterocephalus glaber]